MNDKFWIVSVTKNDKNDFKNSKFSLKTPSPLQNSDVSPVRHLEETLVQILKKKNIKEKIYDQNIQKQQKIRQHLSFSKMTSFFLSDGNLENITIFSITSNWIILFITKSKKTSTFLMRSQPSCKIILLISFKIGFFYKSLLFI
jgi:hypothetical protein